MTKNQKGFVVVLIAGALGYLVYRKQFPSKRNQIHYLISGNFTTTNINELLSRGDDYIKAWFMAAKDGKQTFVLTGTSYNVQGGASVK